MRLPGRYRAALRLARASAALAPQVVPGLAATVRANLRIAFGCSDERLLRATYRHFAEAITDLLFFESLFDPRRPERHFTWVGDAHADYLERGRPGAVLVTGHFGNWELFAAAFRQIGVPLAAVARPPETEWFGRRIDRFRKARGVELIEKDNALPLAMKALRRGTCVAFLMDQAAGRQGVPVPFFGHPARTVLAPAALALKFDLPLYAGYSTRLGDGIRYRCHAEKVEVGGDPETLSARAERDPRGLRASDSRAVVVVSQAVQADARRARGPSRGRRGSAAFMRRFWARLNRKWMIRYRFEYLMTRSVYYLACGASPDYAWHVARRIGRLALATRRPAADRDDESAHRLSREEREGAGCHRLRQLRASRPGLRGRHADPAHGDEGQLPEPDPDLRLGAGLPQHPGRGRPAPGAPRASFSPPATSATGR